MGLIGILAALSITLFALPFSGAIAGHLNLFGYPPPVTTPTATPSPTPSLPRFSIADNMVLENAGVVLLTISLDKVSANTTSVRYRTQNGTALAPGDYLANPGTNIVFPPRTFVRKHAND